MKQPFAFHFPDAVRFLLILIILLIPYVCLPFYPPFQKILLAAGIALFGLWTIIKPVGSLCFLLFVSIFFGNHPGGKYMEVYDFLLMTWVGLAEFVTRKIRVPTFAHGFEWLFLFSGLLSVLANPFLIRDMFHHYLHPFLVFTAVEDHPFYVLKMLIMTAVCISVCTIVYRLYLKKGIRVFHWLGSALAMGVAIIIFAGILEAHVPQAREFLGRYRATIDVDFDDAKPHAVPLLEPLQKSYAVRGLFWNRGWFSIYLIAALPFLMSLYHRFIMAREGMLQKWGLSVISVCLLFYVFVLIGARGALIAFLFSMLFYFICLRSSNQFQKFVLIIPYAVLIFTFLFPLIALIEGTGHLLQARTGFFRAGLAIGFGHPFFGGGIEGFGWNNYIDLHGNSLESSLNSSHNQMLQVFSGQGLLGLISYVCITLMVLRPLNPSRTGDKNHLPLISGFLGILVYSSFQEWFYLRPVQLFWWLAVLFIMTLESNRSCPRFFAAIKKWRWTALGGVIIGTLLVAVWEDPPREFGLSKPKLELDKEWRWVTGREGWYHIPGDTRRVILRLRNRRKANNPLVVTVEIPQIYENTVRFDQTRNSAILKIDLPEGSKSDKLRIRCDRSLSPAANYRSLDSRKLCIFTNLELIPAPYLQSNKALTIRSAAWPSP